jgi:glycosyltransferase involved in cell wall biosynthesis
MLLSIEKEGQIMNCVVSIVLPTYNGSRYLAKSIESCMTQTYKNLELIIVNDCSEDDTLAIAESCAARDSRIRIISNVTNHRLPYSLNIGFAVARGSFLTWTSDDNMYKPTALKTMVDRLSDNRNIGLIYADMDIIDENDNELGMNRGAPDYGYPDELPIVNVVGNCFLYRREICETIGGYDASMEMVEDWDYWMRIWLKYKMAHIPQSLYKCRRHPKSLSSTRRSEQLKKSIELVMNNNLKYENEIPEDLRMRAYLKCIGASRQCEDTDTAAKCFKLATEISKDASKYLSRELLCYVT